MTFVRSARELYWPPDGSVQSSNSKSYTIHLVEMVLDRDEAHR